MESGFFRRFISERRVLKNSGRRIEARTTSFQALLAGLSIACLTSEAASADCSWAQSRLHRPHCVLPGA